jgi:endonuclease I
MGMKECPKCKIKKSLSDFNKSSNRVDGLQRICKLCSRAADKKSYLETKTNNPRIRLDRNNKVRIKRLNWVNEFKKEGCKKCGELRYYVLDFHHLDPSQKDFDIACGGFGYEKLEQEIKKCVLLCSNCHREFHHKERNEYITIEEYLSKQV